MMIKIITLLFFLIVLLIGLLLAFKPASAIELQRRFYLLINWKIEPVSLPKELRNTRLMGIFLIIFLLAALIFLPTR